MPVIELEVDQELFQKFQNCGVQTRKLITNVASDLLRLEQMEESKRNEELDVLIKKVSNDAKVKGMTPQVFKEIMEIDDEEFFNLFGYRP